MGPLIVIAIILLIILIAIISNVKIVPQAHAYVVEDSVLITQLGVRACM